MRRRVVLVIACVLVVVVAVGGWFGWRALHRTAYEDAVASLPKSTLRATYTDWAAVRRLAHGSGLGSSSSTRDVSNFVSRAYDLDLTSTSAVVDSTYALNRRFGVSPLDAEWEMYGQSREGAVAVMKFGDGVDLGGVERNLRSLGYTPPSDGAGSGGVWAGSSDLVAQIDPSLTPVMQNVVVLPDEHLVLMSDDQAYASTSAAVVKGSEPGLDEVDGVPALASEAGEPASAVLWASDFACEALSMGSASEEDQTQAEDLVSAAGGVSPLSGVVVAMHPDRSMVVGMHFESSEQASDDLRPRVKLASGDAVGQGGTFPERFRVAEAASDGQEITMQLEPAGKDLPLLSDLTEGPLLFATC
ncbi:MAG TPA: hypothetical protein VK204_12575 [Nocardioidaceae bacterium]|nr:hypothetical protein [Nocardioidaceae bacterium]